MLIVLCGKTCSGKSYIQNQLYEKYNIPKIITYTTRPMRNGEVQDESYHFISKDEFRQKLADDFFLEVKSYQTAHGEWLYGTGYDDITKTNVGTHSIILTPDGIRDLTRELPELHVLIVYVNSSVTTIQERLMMRGDSKIEANRRIEHDNKDFKNVGSICDIIVDNFTNCDIDDALHYILYKSSRI